MAVSYILDKKALSFLWVNCGGNEDDIPLPLYEKNEPTDFPKITERLKKLGLLHTLGKRIDVERTIGFLIESMIAAEKVDLIGKMVIFCCKKLVIAAGEDRFSDKKCRLVPMKNNEELEKYLAEQNEDISYEEDSDEFYNS